MKKVDRLRKQHPKFIYESYDWNMKGRDLEMSFSFLLPARKILGAGGAPDIRFRPKVGVKNIDPKRIAELAKHGIIDNFVFHVGLAEIPSYWKAAASPVIEIKAGNLDQFQRAWWKKLIYKGMGEYFYANRIDFTARNFLTIISRNPHAPKLTSGHADISKYRDRVLVPMGGGKDSIVTLEVLKQNFPVRCFTLNPTKRVQKIIEISKTASPIVAKRAIDPTLLALNAKGYLNGHTPFSSYLAFLSTFCAAIFDYRYIAFSNERSANEGNVKFYDRIINHQYSKSYEFERDFRIYTKRHLSPSIEYFSFLRPLYELQIARAFTKLSQYFPYALSCNKGQKTQHWCGECSKCLFVYVMVYPFLGNTALMRIFGSDLFEKKKLFQILEELAGIKRHKPFDCVGTKKEVLYALSLAMKANNQKRRRLPKLLIRIKVDMRFKKGAGGDIFRARASRHFLPQKFLPAVRQLLSS